MTLQLFDVDSPKDVPVPQDQLAVKAWVSLESALVDYCKKFGHSPEIVWSRGNIHYMLKGKNEPIS